MNKNQRAITTWHANIPSNHAWSPPSPLPFQHQMQCTGSILVPYTTDIKLIPATSPKFLLNLLALTKSLFHDLDENGWNGFICCSDRESVHLFECQ